MKWRLKGMAQKVLAHVPAGQRINSLLQQRGGEARFHSEVDSKVVDDWFIHLERLAKLAMPLEGRTFLEIGTGWFPTLPTCYSLIGVGSCFTYDLHRLLDFRLTRAMGHRLRTHLPAIAARTGIDEATLAGRIAALEATESVEDYLQAARIEYYAPADASATTLRDASIDVIFSNSVLEHVTSTALDALMVETRRILKPTGLAIHSVNCGDHYAYFDRSITQINYLRYSDAQWRLWNNDLQYQNRLRANDFVASAERAGLKVILNEQTPRAELLEQLKSMPVAAEFKRYSPEQLCTTSITFAVTRG